MTERETSGGPAALFCPLCGAADAKPLHGEQSGLPLRRCACGMVFLHPCPGEEQLREIYQADYYRSWAIENSDGQGPQAMKQLTFRKRLNRIAGSVSPGKVLDVGCASGYFLEVAETNGWQAFGVELSEYSAQLARSTFGERVFNGSLHEAHYPDSFFDLVTLSDLLEHIPEPGPFLREVRRILRHDGSVLVVTPDITSLSACIMGRRWSHFKAEHVSYFSPTTIRRLFEEQNFSVELLESAPKYLNLAYIFRQFESYPHPLLTPLCRFVGCLLPTMLKQLNFPVLCGEMLVLARRNDTGGRAVP